VTKPPLILVTPDIEAKGAEFGDLSLSLSLNYQRALLSVGALPLVMPVTVSRGMLAAAVRQADGVLLTGGEDVNPDLYATALPAAVRRTIRQTPDGGARDLRELIVVDEVFRQRKPLLAICRGQQLLNVALGGDLVADIPRQVKGALNHRQRNRKSQVVHDVHLTPDALLTKITGKQTLGVNSTHHQAVGRPAEVLRVVGRSRDGVIEALELKPEKARLLPFLLSVQFHPERLANRHPEHHVLFAAFARACAANRDRTL
jgi:putative glutamine amidotransferase